MGKQSRRSKRGGLKPPPEVVCVPKLKVEDRVTMRGLNQQVYNGRAGTVVSLPKEPLVCGRYGILVLQCSSFCWAAKMKINYKNELETRKRIRNNFVLVGGGVVSNWTTTGIQLL